MSELKPWELDYEGVGAKPWEFDYGQPAQAGPKPVAIGAAAFPETLRQEVRNLDPITRGVVGAGTALSNAYEGGAQFFGASDPQQLMANRIFAEEAPVGALAGNVALYSLPALSPWANTLKGATATGAAIGALQPVEGSSLMDVVRGKATNTAIGGAAGLGGQVAANWFGARLQAAREAAAQRQARGAIQDATLREAQGAGYVVPPSMAGAGPVSRTLEAASGKYKTNQLASIRNEVTTNRLAARALGLPDNTPISPDVLQGLRSQAFNAGYEPVRAAGAIRTDATYTKALDDVLSQYRGAARSFPGAFDDQVTALVEGRSVQRAVPERSVFADQTGNVVQGVQIPKQPKVRNLLDEIKRSGGISQQELADLGIDVAQANKMYPGLFRKDGGMRTDRLSEWMQQQEWLDPAMIARADELDAGGSHELVRDQLRAALAKDPVIHPRDQDAWYGWADAMRQLDEAGVNKVTIPGKEGSRAGGFRVDEFDAGDAIQAVQLLRNKASESFAKGEKGIGIAQRKVAQAIEDQIERDLMQRGEPAADMLKQFREARKLMAKTHSVERALVEASGNIDARKLAAQRAKGAPLSDELLTIAKFGQQFPDVAGVPKSGWANPFTVVDLGLGSINALGATAAGLSPLAAAVLPAARVGARYSILSQPWQQRFVHPSYGPGMTNKLLGGLAETGVLPGLAAGYAVPALGQ